MAEADREIRHKLDDALGVYQRAMQAYFASAFRREWGHDWFRELVAGEIDSHNVPDSVKRDYWRKLANIDDRREDPAAQLEESQFPFIVEKYGAELFGGRFDEDEVRRMRGVAWWRNQLAHRQDKKITADRVNKQAFPAILDILRALPDHSAVDEVERIRRRAADPSPDDRDRLGASAPRREIEEREARARREWMRARLTEGPEEELEPWQKERLLDLEWEEEWELRIEREEITRLETDPTALRRWFEDITGRQTRHGDALARLEQSEIKGIGDDIDRLRDWFGDHSDRQRRHWHAWERVRIDDLLDDTIELRKWFDGDRMRAERHPQVLVDLCRRELLASERSEIDRLRSDPIALRTWFDSDVDRKLRHEHEWESFEIAELAHRSVWLRRWFDESVARRHRHPAVYSELERRERLEREALISRERRELADLGKDRIEERRWFDWDAGREQRHPEAHAELLQSELWKREQSEYAEIEPNLSARRRWFDEDAGRKYRHQRTYAELQAEERVQRERADYARVGSDVAHRRSWFNKDTGRKQRHGEAYRELQEAERQEERDRERVGRALVEKEQHDATERRRRAHAELAARERIERERADYARVGSDVAHRRSWFNKDTGRKQRHGEAYRKLQEAERQEERDREQRERDAQAERNRVAEAQRVAVERHHRERAELERIGGDPAALGQWFDKDIGRKQRHGEAYRELQRDRERAEQELTEHSPLVEHRLPDLRETGLGPVSQGTPLNEDERRETPYPTLYADLLQEEQEDTEKQVVHRLRIGAMLLSICVVGTALVVDFTISFDDRSTLLVFRGLAMLGSILFVAALPKWRRWACAAGVVGYAAVAGSLAEPFDSVVTYVDSIELGDDDLDWEDLLMFPALIVATQLDIVLHQLGSVTAACAGMVIGSGVALASRWLPNDYPASEELTGEGDTTDTATVSLFEFARVCLGVLAFTATIAPVAYAIGHAVAFVVFLVVVGIPFVIVDMFADIAMDRNILPGDGFVLWTLVVTTGAMALGGVGQGLTIMTTSFLRLVAGDSQGIYGKLSAVVFLVLAAVPTIIMFGLLAFPDLYFERLVVLLLDWAS